MNKSKEYIMLKSNQRRQPAVFKRTDWMHGDVEEMIEFLRKYYNQKLQTPFPDEPPKEEGFVLLYDYNTSSVNEKGEAFNIPVKIMYDPGAKFNTFSCALRLEQQTDLDIKHALLAAIINLKIYNNTEGKKIKSINKKKLQIKMYVGDFVSGKAMSGEDIYALPLKFQVGEREE